MEHVVLCVWCAERSYLWRSIEVKYVHLVLFHPSLFWCISVRAASITTNKLLIGCIILHQRQAQLIRQKMLNQGEMSTSFLVILSSLHQLNQVKFSSHVNGNLWRQQKYSSACKNPPSSFSGQINGLSCVFLRPYHTGIHMYMSNRSLVHYRECHTLHRIKSRSMARHRHFPI